MKVLTILEYFWDEYQYQGNYFGSSFEEGSTRQVIEDFWFDWEFQEKTHEEHRSDLIEAGCDPDATLRRVKMMIANFKANAEMEKRLKEIAT